MNTYSVLDALRKTKMGKLSYCRDFDIKDLERLSISPTPDAELRAGGDGRRRTADHAVSNGDRHAVGADADGRKMIETVADKAGRIVESEDWSKITIAETTTTTTTTTTLKTILQRPNLSPATANISSPSSSATKTSHTPPPPKSSSRRLSKVTFQVETPERTTTPTTPTTTTPTTPTLSPAPSSLSNPQTRASLESDASIDSSGFASPASILLSDKSPRSPRSPSSPTSITNKEWDMLKALSCYEMQLEERTRLNLHRLETRMIEASKLHQLRAEEEYERKKRDLESRQEKQYQDLQSKSFASMQETRRTIQKKLATDAKHKDDLQAKLRETELHKQEYDRKRAKEKREILNSLVGLETDMESMEEEILESLRSCRFLHLLSEGSKIENVQNLLETMRKYLTGQNAAVRESMLDDGGVGGAARQQQRQQQMAKCLSQSIEVVETVKKVKATVADEIRRVDIEGEKYEKEQILQKEEEEKRKAEEEAAAAAATETKKKEEECRQAAAAAAAERERKNAEAFARGEGDAGSRFLALTRQKLTEFESLYSSLATDKEPATKKVKFELQKAVNTLVNSLANDPTEHRHRGDGNLCSCPSIQTVGRLKKLVDLHCGRRIDSGSGKFVCVADHPQGLSFVSDLTAKKIVKQGSDVVASNKEHAYPVAAVSVALWIHNPAFGKLLIARFYEICVFTVPHYPKRQPDQSQSDYFSSLGYLMDGDKAENQDDFLTRMSGIIRLFATICLTQPPPMGLFGNKNLNDAHPFGLPAAWNWLISHLRLDPIPDVSATILYEFLVVLGNALLKTYTKQFTKVVVVLIKTYLPRIEAVTLEGRLGPVMRLKEFLETSIRCGGVEPPKGQLPDHFWTPAEQTYRDQY